jgi:hypothetical protein
MSRKLRSEAAALSEILADHRQTVPRALACAIERLVVTSSRLAKHVQAVNDLQPAFNQPAQVAQPWIPLTPVQQVCLPPADSRISSTGTGTLTPEEMRSFGAADGGAAAEDDDFSKQRYSYDCLQTVVPKFDGIASAARAARVRCHEISAQGVSFFWPGVPDFERAIISLGLERDPIFMRAEVAQSKAVFMHNELQVLVETRFTGRYESSSQRKTTLPAIVSSNSDAELAFAASP